jgi:hypothetical protein
MTKHSFLLAITLIALGSGVSSCHGQLSVTSPDPIAPNFPFTIMDKPGSIVFISPEYYNQKNLHDFFLWHYKIGLIRQNAPEVRVFTDQRLLAAYLKDRRKGPREPDPKGANATPASSPWYYRRSTFSDARYSKIPSEPSLDPSKGDGRYSRGYNVTYLFAPDLTQPNVLKEVVLRGATWRQGKYNSQAREFPWQSSKITLTAYDIYNVEPSGRYHTFSITKHSNEGENGKIIFNILLSDPPSVSTNQVKILNDKIAYVYLGWMYSVSLDGGLTWHLWDAEKTLPSWECCDSGLIQDINIDNSGNGRMALRVNPNNLAELLYLYTNDYGQHWIKD